MKKLIYLILSLSVVLAACTPAATPTPSPQTSTSTTTGVIQLPTMTPEPPTVTPETQASETPSQQAGDWGPTNFPAVVDPLTGLHVAMPSLLDRRPLLVKVSNLPRNVRPQWGLSLADLVYEYYTEEGSTRFAALFYGNDASMVGPIRSARFMDVNLVRAYKAVFAFGSAYVVEMNRLMSSEFANRLVVEGDSTPLTRYEPNGQNYLVVNTAMLSAYITTKGVENGRQDLDGMTFKVEVPTDGEPANQVYLRYSGSIYNRWDYDPTTGKYLRFADTADDFNENNPQYAQSSDRLTGRPLAFDNVVVLFVTHELYAPNIYDILFNGTGVAYAFRDGQAYKLTWQRTDPNAVVSLAYADGTPFPFKPGTTWFEVVGTSSTLQQNGQSFLFHHYMP
jgi:hypothetical protein